MSSPARFDCGYPVHNAAFRTSLPGLGDIGKRTQRWKLEGRVAQIGKPYASDGERGNGLGYFEQYGVFNVLRAGDVSRSGDLGILGCGPINKGRVAQIERQEKRSWLGYCAS